MTGADLVRVLGGRLLASAVLPVPPPEQHAPPRPDSEPATPRDPSAAWAAFAGWLEALLCEHYAQTGNVEMREEIERRRKELMR